jgi:hypothetical protein
LRRFTAYKFDQQPAGHENVIFGLVYLPFVSAIPAGADDRWSKEVIVVLNRLRKLVFRVRSQSPNARFGDSLRRVNRLARLMTIMQRKPGRKAS